MKQKKRFSYAEQSQRLRVKKVSKDEDLFGKLCELFGSDAEHLRQTLADQNSSDTEVTEAQPISSDGIWKAVPAIINPDLDSSLEAKMEELPYSTESCVVEVPTAIISESDQVESVQVQDNSVINTGTSWDLDSAFAEAESLASIEDDLKDESAPPAFVESAQNSRRKVIEDMKKALFELHNLPASSSAANSDDSPLASSSRKTSLLLNVDDLYVNIRKGENSMLQAFDRACQFTRTSHNFREENALKDSESQNSQEHINEDIFQTQSDLPASVSSSPKRKVSVCLTKSEVQSLQKDLSYNAVKNFKNVSGYTVQRSINFSANNVQNIKNGSGSVVQNVEEKRFRKLSLQSSSSVSKKPIGQRKVSMCLSDAEVKSLQEDLAVELKKAVENFAKKRSSSSVKVESLAEEMPQAISTVDNKSLLESSYHLEYCVKKDWDSTKVFSRGASERSSSSSVELPLCLMLSKPKAGDTASESRSNVYDSVYEASVTDYEPESPRDSLEHFDFESPVEKEENGSLSSSTDSGVPSSGGSKKGSQSPSPHIEERRKSIPCPLTFYTNPALESQSDEDARSPQFSDITLNGCFEADRAFDEDAEETFSQIIIDVASEGEKRIRFAPSMESINSFSTIQPDQDQSQESLNRGRIITLALSAVRIWTQLKAYLSQSAARVETVIDKAETEINNSSEPDLAEFNSSITKAVKPVRTGARRISSDLHIKYVQLARDHTWLPKARIHQETSDWLQDVPKGLNSFEELRKYVKDGGDMAKEIAAILHERTELEASYAKGLSKLAAKLMKSSRETSGTIASAWQAVGSEMETEAELHKTLAVSMSEELVKPVRCVIENHHRSRKAVEVTVDKTARGLAEWRAAQAKAKKQCYLCARENEKMQDTGFNDSKHGRHRTLSEKETAKLDVKRKKSEDAQRKADVEYYAYCVRAERARLDWEAATCRGSRSFQTIEEERLTTLRDLASRYLTAVKDIGPKLVQSADRLSLPVARCNIDSDLQPVVNLRSAATNTAEQLLPDFYAEHMSNIMNRERRKETMEKCLHLIRSDIEREKRAKMGVENLARALQETPNFGTQDSQQDVSDKLKHLKSMLAFLEATKVKVMNALADLENRPKAEHPLVKYLEVHKDKQGLIQSVLKLPSWAQELDSEGETPPGSNSPDFPDRGTGDGTSVQPDSDSDEFSSQESDCEEYPHSAAESIPSPSIHNSPDLETSRTSNTSGTGGRCRALYTYSANMYDELTIHPGDIINIHDKQEDGWWVGELEGNVGIFPATYVEEYED